MSVSTIIQLMKEIHTNKVKLMLGDGYSKLIKGENKGGIYFICLLLKPIPKSY